MQKTNLLIETICKCTLHYFFVFFKVFLFFFSFIFLNFMGGGKLI